MKRLERKFLAHYIDVGMNSSYTNYVRLGKDLEEYKEELNPQINVQRDLKGEPCARVGGYQAQSEAEYYYAYQGEVLFDVLSDIANKRLTDSSCRTTKVDVLVDIQGRQIWAYREDCLLVPSYVGGDTSGVQIPFTIVNSGNRTFGVFNKELNEFTPSDEPAKVGMISPLRIYADGEYVAPQGRGYSPVIVDTGGGEVDSEYALVLMDWDGSVVKQYTYDQLRSLEALPANSTRNGYTCGGWNWTLNDVKRWCRNARGFTAYVGQYYVPNDYDVKVVLDLPSYLLSPKIALKYSGRVVISWGDSTSNEYTDSSGYYMNVYGHTYSAAGRYEVKISFIRGSSNIFELATMGGAYAPFVMLDNSGGTSYAKYVKSIDIGSSVSGYSRALLNCINLESVSIAVTIDTLEVFKENINLENIVFPSYGSTVIGDSFLSSCTSLRFASLPTGIVSIKQSAFYSCSCLEGVSLPDTLVQIYSSAFKNCRSLKKMFIPSLVTSIGNGAFDECYNLKTVKFGGTVTTIDSYAFRYCDLSDGIEVDAVTISTGAFSYSKVKNVVIGDSITTIGQYAFRECRALESVEIGQSASYGLASYCFDGCYSLMSISMDGATSIGSYCFNYCYALNIDRVPNSVTTIGAYAFYSCYALEKITIPSAVTSVGNYAFASCIAMREAHFLGTTPPTFGTAIFGGVNDSFRMSVIVPYSSDHSVLNAYKTATNFVQYADYIAEESP